jgi:hypothetical protein
MRSALPPCTDDQGEPLRDTARHAIRGEGKSGPMMKDYVRATYCSRGVRIPRTTS